MITAIQAKQSRDIALTKKYSSIIEENGALNMSFDKVIREACNNGDISIEFKIVAYNNKSLNINKEAECEVFVNDKCIAGNIRYIDFCNFINAYRELGRYEHPVYFSKMDQPNNVRFDMLSLTPRAENE